MNAIYLYDDATYANRVQLELGQLGVACELLALGQLSDVADQLAEREWDVALVAWPTSGNDRFQSAAAAVQQLGAHRPLIGLATMDAPDEAIHLVDAGWHDYLVKCELDGDLLVQRLQFASRRGQLIASHQPAAVATGGKPALAAPAVATPSSLMIGMASRPFRLLSWLVDADLAQQVASSLTHNNLFHVHRVKAASLSELIERGGQDDFDAILVGQPPQDDGSYHVVGSLAQLSDAPLIVTGDWNDLEERLALIDAGSDDVVDRGQLDRFLVRWLRLATSRSLRRPRRRSDPATPGYNSDPSPQIPPSERRKSARYMQAKPLVVVPVLPDNTPDGALRSEGFTCDVSAAGLGFEIGGLTRLPSRTLLVGVEGDDGVLYFCSVDVRNSRPAAGRLRVGASFSEGPRDLIRNENLIPHLDPVTHRFTTGLPRETLHKWVELGIFRPMLLDRALLCPKCKALPTFRNGCRACGSVRLANQQLIHHFACAYVGYISEFEQQGELACPKCRTRRMIVGADFEYLNGPYRCIDCSWSDTEMEVVGHCLRCDWRFPLQQAHEEELIGYHVNRLDPLALIDTQ